MNKKLYLQAFVEKYKYIVEDKKVKQIDYSLLIHGDSDAETSDTFNKESSDKSYGKS